MENIKKIIECSICADTFSDPKMLPCVHTFCLKCLETLKDKVKQPESKLSCPLCRNECLIPAGGMSCLPNNYFVQNLLEIENITAISSKALRCESCEEGSGEEDAPVSEASMYCLDCQQSFCTQCHKAHDKMRFNKSHKVIKPKSLNLESDGLMKMTLSFCDKHQDEPVKHYCLDCKIIICLSCYVEEHSTHKCSSIGKEAEQARLQMREDMAGVQKQSDKLLAVSTKIEVEKKRMVDELSAFKQLKMKELETAKELNDRHQLMMDSYTRYVKEVITQATDAELLRCAGTMKTRAADLKAIYTPSDFSAGKIELRTRSSVVEEINAIQSNSLVSDPLLLHNETLQATEKILINQYQHMTSLEDELYILSPTVKTNLALNQGQFYVCLPNNILPNFPVPQPNNGYQQQQQQQQPAFFTHLLLFVYPAYYETAEASFIKFTFNNIRPHSQTDPQLKATFNIPENYTISLFGNETVEDTHAIDIQCYASNGSTYLTIDVQITYGKSSITVSASNVRLSTGTVAPTSVEIMKEIRSTLPLMVYSSLSYEKQRQMNLTVRTRRHIDVTDMTSCSYYNCIYIGDRANCVIHRFEQLGSSSQLKLRAPSRGLSVTKQHTLLLACSTNKVIEMSTNGITMREINLSGLTNPRRVIRLEEEEYLVTGDLSNIRNHNMATGNSPVQAFLVDATGRGQPLGSALSPEILDVTLDKHGCILILNKNNTIQIRNTQEKCEIKEISLSDHSLSGCDQMHFDTAHGRLYVANSKTSGLTVFKME